MSDQSIDHENVLTVLFDALKNAPVVAGIGGFRTIGRRLRYWDDITEQPAMFLRHIAVDDTYSGQGLGMTTLEGEIWVFSKAGADPDDVPAVQLSQLVTAIRAVFVPDDFGTGEFTLGGLVQWCRIEGRSDLDPGDADGQGKAVIPVRILLP